MDQKDQLLEQLSISQRGYITDSYSMSIGEFMNMYRDKELIVNPKYQREFRWSDLQQSRFIESILLQIPLPSIFIFQDKKKWEVIDGLQRLSTIFLFTGISELKDKEGNSFPPTVLKGTKTIKALESMQWSDFNDEIQFDFKKTKMEVKIIKDVSLEKSKAKFELFQRLNQKPSILSGQEYRNALLIMYDERIFDWLKSLSEYSNFRNCISGLEDRWLKEQYDKELILRLFVFPMYDLKSKFKKVDDYLDDSIFYSEDGSLLDKIENGEFSLESEKLKFEKTFDILYKAKGAEIFKRSTGSSGQQFLESYYEAIAIGLYFNIDNYSEDDIEFILSKIDNLEGQDDFKKARGIGTNTEIRIKKLVPFSKVYFSINE
ncbi:DUF262 domain-containing protein [uncultured Mucilaginibacter sp.]|uniref:DUF262 domain-containing protein n=1 Tax=uncultured Mucilaginibacter sp. TaxID=797541 RepID=UPI002638D6CD|nr:DUF262 domain-containing protein [uncultured Mucilaginibacter sp.]